MHEKHNVEVPQHKKTTFLDPSIAADEPCMNFAIDSHTATMPSSPCDHSAVLVSTESQTKSGMIPKSSTPMKSIANTQ